MNTLLYLFTLGYILQFLAQGFIMYNIKKVKSIDGLSLDSQIILMISNVVRIFWMVDNSLYKIPLVCIEILLTIILQGYILYLFNLYKDSQYVKVKSIFNLKTIIPICLLISLFFNPGTKFFSFEIFISFSFYLESLSQLPQIYLMKKIGTIDIKIGKYLVIIAASRLIRILFWITYILEGEYFYSLLLADIIHTILLADFVWIYFQNQGRGNMIII